MSANDTQIGGDHYKASDEQLAKAKGCGINKVPEPWDFSYIRGHNNLQTGIIKYVDRYLKKNGLQDLEKAKHYLDKLIEIEKAKKPWTKETLDNLLRMGVMSKTEYNEALAAIIER